MNIRVGVLSNQSISDQDALSGVPAKMYDALAKLELDVIDLNPEYQNNTYYSLILKIIRTLKNMKHSLFSRFLYNYDEYQKHIVKTVEASSRAQDLIDESKVDIVVGVCISSLLYKVRNDIPIVYASDTTAKLINSTYERYSKLSSEYHRACEEFEITALAKCDFFLPASKCTAESGINDYNLPPEKVKVIEFGANVTPDSSVGARTSPMKSNLELSLVAADPVRKRLTFCIEVAEILKKRGWNVKLNYIGKDHSAIKSSNVVKWYGRLQLSKHSDRIIHQDILRRSHWMILPSKAECFGIAPCEAAHFGRPSIVSNVEGLPTVIKHNETGIVMPVDASATDYADNIERISLDQDKYQAFSAAALERAQNSLSWSVWASKVEKIIIELVKVKQ